MYKPASLRAFLTAANPELAQDPDRLVVFIDAGNLRATYEPVHPRMRGEHSASSVSASALHGPSPHARGTRQE